MDNWAKNEYQREWARKNKKKTCESHRKWSQKLRGVTSIIYRTQKRGAIKRKQHLPVYTLGDFRIWCFSHPLFFKLFIYWRDNGHKRLDKPSVDRIDILKSYTFDNLQVMSCGENIRKGRYERCRLPKMKYCYGYGEKV